MTIDNSPQNALTMYTIGHSNIMEGEVIRLLQQYEIEVLVDVRSSPYSQFNPQFNRETLKQTLLRANIEYRYAGDYLGGRPKDASCYKDGRMPDAHADFLHLVDYPAVMKTEFFRKGIERLLKLALESVVAIMCSEEDPQKCHRHHLIGKYLTELGVSVLHIRGDGRTVPDQQLKDVISEPQAFQHGLFG